MDAYHNWCIYVTWTYFYPQAKSERNYHIFYEMLAGLPPNEKHPLYLQEAETYYYLNQVVFRNSLPTTPPEHRSVDTVIIFTVLLTNDVSVYWTYVINFKKWLMAQPLNRSIKSNWPLNHGWRGVISRSFSKMDIHLIFAWDFGWYRDIHFILLFSKNKSECFLSRC